MIKNWGDHGILYIVILLPVYCELRIVHEDPNISHVTTSREHLFKLR